MVANGGAVLIGGHPEPHDTRAIEMNHDPVDPKDDTILREWVLPGM